MDFVVSFSRRFILQSSLAHSVIEQVQSLSGDAFWYAYGHFFVKVSATLGYTKMISCIGRDFVEFLKGLNNLHLHISLSMPGLVPPDFRVEEATSHSAILHYRSTRPGLGPFVVGICQGVGSALYDLHNVDFELIQSRDNGSSDHEVWKVSFHGSKARCSSEELSCGPPTCSGASEINSHADSPQNSHADSPQNSNYAENSTSTTISSSEVQSSHLHQPESTCNGGFNQQRTHCAVKSELAHHAHVDSGPQSHYSTPSTIVHQQGSMYSPTAALFYKLFPFHMVLDRNMQIIQVCAVPMYARVIAALRMY
ncbi:hypothetical protein CEUSTIGMA_g839.t1 [Chlamydomonas eustigma]|uniref:Heme NO-binding domain-containing protein n=1 Tax=Chlamydomonas eustigma TaxID=1157962 RepID=A0A250WRQ7_9CHLO|nr:hypothetical protein CEUSTIGMA_g839.t1 [Chlamydomonas eustigma]|eukprot:GAX73386.1 hypothetical protein CEUSTIGMA_g839.t1 [Chlamydomonas eustigma]